MAKRSPQVDREVRIELLRAKAALEREALAYDIAYAGESLKPANALRSLWPAAGQFAGQFSGQSGNVPRIAMQAYQLFRQYPMIGSGLSAVLLQGGRKTRIAKVAVLGLVGWKLLSMWRQRSGTSYPD